MIYLLSRRKSNSAVCLRRYVMKNKENNKNSKFFKNKPLLFTTIGIGIAGLLIVIYIILGFVFGSMNPTKWGKTPDSDAPSDEPSIICAIFYPDLQENGDIWQTGGMQPTHAKNLREALETDFNDEFFTFSEDGTIASAGDLMAADGYFFKIQKNTTRSPEELSDKPADIELADSETYEIIYCDPNGEALTVLPEAIKEIIESKPDDSTTYIEKKPDSYKPEEDPTGKTSDTPTEGNTQSSGSSNTEGSDASGPANTENVGASGSGNNKGPGTTDSPNNGDTGNSNDDTEPTFYTDPETGDTIVVDIF